MAKKKSRPTDKLVQELRAFGLAYPGAHTKSPWPGHLDLAVNDKTFAYLSIEGEPFGISCKLPQSASVALMLPFCTPAAYGLGKSGWVAAKFPDDKIPSVAMLKEWIDESYRAQAPKKFLKQLEAGAMMAPPVVTPPKAPKVAKAAKAAKAPAAKSSATKTPAAKVTKPTKKPARQRVS